MHVQAKGENVRIRLEPRLGQRFDTEQLRGCLDYTTAQIDPV